MLTRQNGVGICRDEIVISSWLDMLCWLKLDGCQKYATIVFKVNKIAVTLCISYQ